MQLCALRLGPLLITRIERGQVKPTVLAYADDVSILLITPSEIPKLQSAILQYEAASGPRINFQKSRAVALVTWNTATDLTNIHSCTELKILGILPQSYRRQNWAMVTGRIRGLARAAYYREVCLAKLIFYVHTYILATTWYTAHIRPMPETCVRQVNSALVVRGHFSRPAVHITRTETGREMVLDQRRSKEPSFVYPLAADPQPRRELNHIRCGRQTPIHIPDTSTVGIFTHICRGHGISLIPGIIGIQ